VLRFTTAIAVSLLLGAAVSPRPFSTALAQSEPDGRLVQIEEGFTLELAGGFEVGKMQDGYYLLGSRKVPGLILVKLLPALTDAELSQGMRSGYRDRSVELMPEGAPAELPVEGGSGRFVEVTGELLKSEVRGLLAGYLRPSSGGLLILAVTAPSQWPELKPAAEQIIRGVKLFEPDPAELIRLWKERLSGFRLVSGPAGDRPSSETGEKTYYLCGDGSFAYEGNVAPSPEDRAAVEANAGSRAGSWEIVAAQGRASVAFTFRDGRRQSHSLSRQDQETYLDDQRYFVLATERCP
jgi:hypothetical protein